MKLTWFSGTTLRIHIGGQVIVTSADEAPQGIDRVELVSGADHVVNLGDGTRLDDLGQWRPRARERLVDAGDQPRPIQIFSTPEQSLLIDADDDLPLLLAAGDIPALGRWADRAAIVLMGSRLAERGEQMLERVTPRLIALGGTDVELDAAFKSLPGKLDGTGLIALERGLAVEA